MKYRFVESKNKMRKTYIQNLEKFLKDIFIKQKYDKKKIIKHMNIIKAYKNEQFLKKKNMRNEHKTNIRAD
jgi:hypothetical protein